MSKQLDLMTAVDCNLDVIPFPAFILEPDSGKPVVIPNGLKIWLGFKPARAGSGHQQAPQTGSGFQDQRSDFIP
jgi:hypothetical protein